MGHCATQATSDSPVYWWDETDRHWERVSPHPTPGRFAFVDDKIWVRRWAKLRMGWIKDEDEGDKDA